jgi:sugar phosphate isomerase/epimerase
MPDYSVCQICLPNTDMASDLEMVRAAGVPAIGLLDGQVQRAGVAATKELLAHYGLGTSTYFGSVEVLAGTRDDVVTALTNGIKRAAALATPIFEVSATGPVGATRAPEADAEFLARLTAVAPLARDLGVELTLEPLHPFFRHMTYIHTLAHAAELMSNIDGGTVAIDTGHLFWDRNFYRDLIANIELVTSVQLTNITVPQRGDWRWARTVYEGGMVPLADMVRAIHDAGFHGFYEDESSMPLKDAPERCLSAIREKFAWFQARWDTNGDLLAER